MIVLGAAFLAGCAPAPPFFSPRHRRRSRRPPRRRPREAPPSPASAPGPGPANLYRDAVARTRGTAGHGEGRRAIPLWVALEGTPFAAEAVFNQGSSSNFRGRRPGRGTVPAAPPRRAAAFPTGRGQPAGDRPAPGNRETLRNLVDAAGRTDAARTGERLPELSANLVAALVDLSRFDEAETLYRSVLKREARPRRSRGAAPCSPIARGTSRAPGNSPRSSRRPWPPSGRWSPPGPRGSAKRRRFPPRREDVRRTAVPAPFPEPRRLRRMEKRGPRSVRRPSRRRRIRDIPRGVPEQPRDRPRRSGPVEGGENLAGADGRRSAGPPGRLAEPRHVPGDIPRGCPGALSCYERYGKLEGGRKTRFPSGPIG